MRLIVFMAVAWALMPHAFAQGVAGEAAIIFEDGTSLNCSGKTVIAIPKDKKSTRTITKLYGDRLPAFTGILNTRGYLYVDKRKKAKYRAPNIKSVLGTYLKHTQSTKCAENGRFYFPTLQPGDWYIVAPVFSKSKSSSSSSSNSYQGGSGTVSFSASNSYLGGTLAQEVSLREEVVVEVPLILDDRPEEK